MLRQSDTMRVCTVPPWGPWMLGEVVRGELRGRSRPAAAEAAYGGLWPGPPTILYFPQEEPAGASLSVQMVAGSAPVFKGGFAIHTWPRLLATSPSPSPPRLLPKSLAAQNSLYLMTKESGVEKSSHLKSLPAFKQTGAAAHW